MELWRGTMTAHSVVVYRSDASEGEAKVRFDEDCWLRFVPLRLPWTQLVQEPLPAGAAGVLLNKSHPYRDLILVLDAQEKRLFDAIDGRRSIGDIVDQAAEVDRGRARTLFERLWQYDQVVFDASAAR
jgi:hypothetical protein